MKLFLNSAVIVINDPNNQYWHSEYSYYPDDVPSRIHKVSLYLAKKGVLSIGYT